MKTVLTFILGLFFGGVISSAWWAAAVFGVDDLAPLWAAPVILSVCFLSFLGCMIEQAFDEERRRERNE